MQTAREADPEGHRERQRVVHRAWTVGLTAEESEELRAQPCAFCGTQAPEGGNRPEQWFAVLKEQTM
ncbi:hypothetical protein M878_20125 [Streptomyces roseochromogenus subsp. oscitans DS 12.976]|uniref:Uncharacterized protein n=2 Tax=Streptomyces roseochromogenus TaxID=285450 RepID=V6KBV5_STRRC|nr:hypothetical protein M878_20125 [Streptomyces roseochromogenus subsp. oscitans DS 12.976]